MSAASDPWEFKTIFKIFSPPQEIPTDDKCVQRRKLIGYYYTTLALVSIVYTGLLSHLCRRFDNMRHDTLDNKPRSFKCFRKVLGIPVPVNHVIYRYHSLAYAAAYLCAFNLIGGIFTDTFSMKFDFPQAPMWVGIVFKILAICFMAITVLPIFLSINYGGTFAWSFGILYCFVNLIFFIATITMGFCGTLKNGTHYLSLQLPSMIGYAILSGHFITNLEKHRRCTNSQFFQPHPPNPAFYVNSVTQYVKNRLQIIPNSAKPISLKPKCYQKMSRFFHDIFHPPSGFFYPPVLIWSLSVSVLLHYMLLNRVLVTTNTYVSNGKEYISKLYPDLAKSVANNLDLSNARYVYQSFNSSNMTKEERFKVEYAFIYYMADLVFVGMIISSILAFLVNIWNIMKILHRYQKCSLKLYQKGFHYFPQVEKLLNPFEVTTGTILYPSYQVALMGCGFHLQILLYIFLFILLSVVIGLNAFTPYTFLVDFIHGWWPTFILMFAFNVFQTCLIKCFYTQNRSRTYGFENLRSLQQFMFFASFYNIFFGIINGAMRILFCPISSAVSVARMDMSLFSHSLQSADKAYVSFLGFIYGDVIQNNPILRTFVWLLSSETMKINKQLIHSYDSIFLSECICFHAQTTFDLDAERGLVDLVFRFEDSTKPNNNLDKNQKLVGVKQNIFDLTTSSNTKSPNKSRKLWFLAYTLMRNPQLVRYRKHACHNLIEQTSGII